MPKNSDTCLVIKKSDDIYHVYRDFKGLIDITSYSNNKIIWRNAIILDQLISFFLETEDNVNQIIFSFGDVDDDIVITYNEFIHVNQIYDFSLKCYCAYKASKLSGSTTMPISVAPKKKKIRSPLRKVSDKVDVGVDSASKETPRATKEVPSATKINNGPDTKSLPAPSLRSNLYPVLNEKFDFPEPPSYDPEQPLIML